ncbi:MAG: thiamine pyrophosphate-dependent enzyme [Algoriphagus sp.]|jgi:pyruvate/2-oxoglutarate/acetoin dehydrogenase E1 component/TPP-dependent pyruvate/acetoin dehydrogenase alpha subunit|uniref:alpha-ketoacid dehydrogenase subunit alpha/beta n=1 Tax=Algoriphagus sp. TaxID=1872435 RepID=UPI00274B12E3|nr:thiamine pyrophosphate-dependent enzyme [Algoriphagus sp.]MDP4747564.1 thiamine pyrophosphate-dependent enzyme [Algoriphagus sp.]MDP4839595.1 thiamine pyrophosphate-dependent enzyme [Algoriphagus sp.]MDP4904272.1 thiamine pyrophosphate-dependent enzyme [Algoriphagus sp.]MDP4956481.1 thiamine pyrophosphate-dependent enzyme [Algoriphagus sp.]
MAEKSREKVRQAITIQKQEVLADFRWALTSRHASLMGRKEVFMGKAKFGIFGDGKELAQVAMARAFRKGDFRAGYYRDQTFMMALGELTVQQYFAQLYAHTNVQAEPASAGRLMNGHFATRSLNEDGTWKSLTAQYNSAADISPTAAQMPKLLGLAFASKLYRNNKGLKGLTDFSVNGDEVAWGTIGNASTSEGMFFETLNAAGVLQVPMVVSVWDDGYGISVPTEFHTTKGSISEALLGFQRTDTVNGFEILRVKGWDYDALVHAFETAGRLAREEHVPVLLHVEEMTQPQGHSTSGSHERYKSKERLQWEKDWDCIAKFREHLISSGIATADHLDEIEADVKVQVKKQKDAAWTEFNEEIKVELEQALSLIRKTAENSTRKISLLQLADDLQKTINPIRKDVVSAVRKCLFLIRAEGGSIKNELKDWYAQIQEINQSRYNSHLYSQSEFAVQQCKQIPAEINDNSPLVDGREILQAFFDYTLEHNPQFFTLGQDVGKIGDVNQAFAGLQAKYGEWRVMDTSIRECTILGQGIGAALRGLRPMAEIQYLDYLLYGIQLLSDDLATLTYRTKGGQKAPLIVRTRGHRLEGVWHSGSPMGMILASLRGMIICVPRNMTQAAGMYATLLQSDEPALVIECLNGYRLKEQLPQNIGRFTVPMGIPEILCTGTDLTVVTYGSMCRIVLEAATELAEIGIYLEVIDVQTLLPFDTNGVIGQSIQKTNRVLFADEDVPGGGAAYMMQQVLDHQGAYQFLDAAPQTLSAQAHRPAYSTDGDYFSKPSVEDVIEKAYLIMHESNPKKYPSL